MMKVEYKGYRIWAILQTNGKYRACLIKPPVTLGTKAENSQVIEGDNQTEAIAKAKVFLDGVPEPNRPRQRAATNF
jgi:hypothetical protein